MNTKLLCKDCQKKLEERETVCRWCYEYLVNQNAYLFEQLEAHKEALIRQEIEMKKLKGAIIQ